MEPFSFSYPQYLDAKSSVDRRSLHQGVWDRFLRALSAQGPDIRVLEVGGGTGITLRRILGAVPTREVQHLRYVLLDERDDNLAAAREALVNDLADAEATIVEEDSSGIQFQIGRECRVRVMFEHADLLDYPTRREASFDVVVAQAVLDLFDVPHVLDALDPVLKPGGLWYLPIHYDGLTALEPTVDAQLDRDILSIYQDSMTSPRSGRDLLTALPSRGADLIRVGASDWIVHAGQEGQYTEKEDYFLKCILWFIYNEVTQHDSAVSEDQIDRWIRTRLRQIESGDLIFLAHQLDILAQKST
jgi:ubiquinone/menaquinone biosynthesis C-methylase UbiE